MELETHLESSIALAEHFMSRHFSILQLLNTDIAVDQMLREYRQTDSAHISPEEQETRDRDTRSRAKFVEAIENHAQGLRTELATKRTRLAELQRLSETLRQQLMNMEISY